MNRDAGGILMIVVAALACVATCRPSDAADDTPAVPRVEEIADVASERNGQFNSLFVRYRMQGKLLGSAEDAKRYLDLVALVDEIKTFAFSKSMRYSALARPDDHYMDIAPAVAVNNESAAPRAEIPKPIIEQQEFTERMITELKKTGTKIPERGLGVIPVEREQVTRFDGELLSTWHAVDKPRIHLMGEKYTSAQEDDGGTFNQTYMWIVFHSISDAFNVKVDRGDHRIPDVLSRFEVRLRPAVEVVHDASCVVIEVADKYVLWCDPALGYTVRKWEVLSPGTEYVTDRYEMRDFTEVSPTMWLPREAVWKRWAPATAPEDVKNTPLMQYDVTVLELHANDVPDSLFKTDMQTIPQNTLVVDNLHTIADKNGFELATNYKKPADATQLDDAVAEAKKTMETEWERRKRGPSKSSTAPVALTHRPWGFWILALNVVLIISAIVALRLYKHA